MKSELTGALRALAKELSALQARHLRLWAKEARSHMNIVGVAVGIALVAAFVFSLLFG